MKYEIINSYKDTLLDCILEFNQINHEEYLDLISEDLKEQQNETLIKPIVERIKKAKENKEKVLVCGDYDCDGVCATSIICKALDIYGVQYGFYIPNRFKEGYGVNLEKIKLSIDLGYSLVITVDNGVKSNVALKYCKQHSVDIILTDHHNYETDELVYDYFLHPNIMSDYYDTLCGAGVALQISEGLIGENDEQTILACIATIGDIMPLIKYNRYLVKKGIKLLNQGCSVHIDALSENCTQYDSEFIAFKIVPLINAVGRLSDSANPNNIVHFFLNNDLNVINDFAKSMHKLNNKRKDLSSDMYEEAIKLIDDDTKFIIVYSEEFHEGMNGLVASRICHEYNKPVIVFTLKEGILKGSIRSNGIDLKSFFKDKEKEFISYGGHSGAAGISLALNDLDDLKAFCEHKIKDFKIDKQRVLKVNPDLINIKEIETLKKLEPFGEGLEKPNIIIDDDIMDVKTLSNGKHLKYIGKIEYLYFNHGYNAKRDCLGNHVYFIGNLSINEYRNQKKVNMIVNDVIK